MDIIIRAARIIDSAGNTAARQQDLLIRKGRIEKIADHIPNDKKLKEVFGKDQVTMFELAGILGKHLA